MMKMILALLLISNLSFATYLGDPTTVKGGGTGLSTVPASGQILIGTGTGYNLQSMSSGATMSSSGVVSLGNSAVTGQAITGYTSGAGTVSATDSILQAIQKLNGNDALKAVATRNINTTAPLAGGGDLSADRTLTCNVASGSQAGCLASADFTTFNGKQASISTSSAVANQFVTGFTAPNTFTRAQPAFTDIYGNATNAQLPTYTNHGVLIGTGSAGIGATSTGTAGQVLTSNGAGADPTFQAAGGGGGSAIAVLTKTTDYTVVTGDFSSSKTLLVECNGSSLMTITLPAASNTGYDLHAKNIGTAECDIKAAGSDGIDGDTTLILLPGGKPISGNELIANGGTQWDVF